MHPCRFESYRRSEVSHCFIDEQQSNGSGDTLWASAYEAYDRLSPALQSFLETLTATHVGQNFIDLALKTGATLRSPRGAPENIGEDLTSVHPVVRTNPVTGWKGTEISTYDGAHTSQGYSSIAASPRRLMG